MIYQNNFHRLSQNIDQVLTVSLINSEEKLWESGYLVFKIVFLFVPLWSEVSRQLAADYCDESYNKQE